MASKHSYYADDTESRKEQFDSYFLKASKEMAEKSEQALNVFLSRITDFNSFKKTLLKVWHTDKNISLWHYAKGMTDEELLEFYERDVIQNILNNGEKVEITRRDVPIDIEQINKEIVKYFSGYFIDYERKEQHRVIAKEVEVVIKGRKIKKFRDSKGRFVRVSDMPL